MRDSLFSGFRVFANNKCADQPVHRGSLISTISTIVIRILESIKSKLAIGGISIFKLVYVAEQAGLSLAFWKPRRQVLS